MTLRTGLPKPRGGFVRLPHSWYRVVILRAQGFTAKQTAALLQISPRTATVYLDRAKDKLGAETVQELLFMVYREYAPDLLAEEEAEDGWT